MSSSRPSALRKRARTEPTMGSGKGKGKGKGKGGGKCADDQDDVTKERNYHWCPDDTEVGAWLHQQLALKGCGKFSKQRVTDVNPHVLELGNVVRVKYRSKLPMTSERERPKKLYIPYCIKNLAPAHNEENNPFLIAWL